MLTKLQVLVDQENILRRFTGNLYFPVRRGSIFALRMQIGRLWGWNTEKEDYSFESFILVAAVLCEDGYIEI